MQESFSGALVRVESIIEENEHLKHVVRNAVRTLPPFPRRQVKVPAGHRTGPAPKEVFDGYRAHFASACADVAVVTRRSNGGYMVIASKRSSHKPFGGMWWMQGGAISSYDSLIESVAERAEAEIGVKPRICARIGTYYTCAEDFPAATVNLCFLGCVAFELLPQLKADADHTEIRLFTLEDLQCISKLDPEWNWYPLRVFDLALKAFEETKR